MNLYQDYIAVSRYARYLPEEKRREIWPETVDRYIKFFSELTNQNLEFLRESIQDRSVLPSMRALTTPVCLTRPCTLCSVERGWDSLWRGSI